MSIDIKEIKEELNQLCNTYIDIVSEMKKEGIINNNTYSDCVSKKIEFLQKNKMLK